MPGFTSERHVVILVEEGVDDREFLYPFYRVQEEGYRALVVGTGKGSYRTKLGLEVKEDLSAEAYLSENPQLEGLLGVIIPGGKAPERLRVSAHVKGLVSRASEKGLPIASICHGPQVLISAGLLKGRKATSYHTIADDVINAGAEYLDQQVVTDGNLITSRHPGDIPAWMREFIKAIRGEG